MHKHARARLLALAALTVLLLSMVVTLAACGSGGGATTGDVKTYTDATYGFTFEYPSDWKLQETADQADVTSGASAAKMVAAYDPDGAKTETAYTDLIEVSIYELSGTVDDSVMSQLEAEVKTVFAGLESQAKDLKVVEDMTAVSTAGVKGWKITYSFDKDGVPAQSTLYLLFGGSLEYQLLIQSATANWQADQAVFQAFVSSFTPKAGSTTSSSASN
jgi:hypothetical protein